MYMYIKSYVFPAWMELPPVLTDLDKTTYMYTLDINLIHQEVDHCLARLASIQYL